MGLFGGLINTWSDGYQFGDILKSALYDLNPIAWAGDALVQSLSGNKDFDLFNNNPNWTPSSEDPIDQGIINTWNKFTGNAHLTPEYQHAEEREDSVNQRTATDMMLAGLSKYGFGGTPAGTSNASNGLTLLDAIGKAQQIKAQDLSLKEMKYNLGVSKRLGIRTGDKNSLGQLTSIVKALFGLDLSDIPEEGIIPAIVNAFKGSGGDGSVLGAVADLGGHVASTGAKATSTADAVQAAIKEYGREEVNAAIADSLSKKGINVSPPPITADSKDFGISDEFAKSANFFMRKMFNDDMLNDQTISHLAGSLSRIYNLPVREVLNYLNDIKKSFSGEVYRFDENDKLHRVY